MSKKDREIHTLNLALANIHFLSEEEIIQSLNTYLNIIDERIEFLDNSIRYKIMFPIISLLFSVILESF